MAMTPFMLMILAKAAEAPNAIASLHFAASASPRWRDPKSRGALTANARRAASSLEVMGYAAYLPGKDRWDCGQIAVTPAGRKFLDESR